MIGEVTEMLLCTAQKHRAAPKYLSARWVPLAQHTQSIIISAKQREHQELLQQNPEHQYEGCTLSQAQPLVFSNSLFKVP